MKVLCDREKLREGLAIVNSVVPQKSTKPILANVYLTATDEALELVGTDLEVAVRYRIEDVKVEDPGPALVPAKVALDFVRDLTGETVEIDSGEGNCTITSAPDSCELVTADPDEYPVVARFVDEGAFSIQGGSFTRLVQRTAFAAAREQGRYAMHGVLVEVEQERLKMVATDGRRLAVAGVPIDPAGGKAPAGPTIVPTKGMQLFCRVITDPLDRIQIGFDENQLGVRTKNAEVFARLLDGEFPRYSAVIPTEVGSVLEADPDLLSRKIRLVANVTGDEARAVKLSLKKGELQLFGQSAGRGEATAHMEVDYKGGKAEIAFNPDYVVDGLKNSELERITLAFNERTAPGKFTLGEDYTYVVMPITIDT